MSLVLLETEIPGVPLCERDKIRDVFKIENKILVVRTDRVYLFDRNYPIGLMEKGRVLTHLTIRTFELTDDIIPNFLITSQVDNYPFPLNNYPEILESRSMLTEMIKPIRLDCVARGYLYGQSWQSYRAGDRSWLEPLPSGLKLAEKLPRPIFTPARKDLGNNDVNLSWREMVIEVGEEMAEKIKDVTLKVYEKMRDIFEQAGFILADTKLEFGEKDGLIYLINEACTPDFSRIWKISDYRPGRIQNSWDKEIMENFLKESGREAAAKPPPLPTQVLEKARGRFVELSEIL